MNPNAQALVLTMNQDEAGKVHIEFQMIQAHIKIEEVSVNYPKGRYSKGGVQIQISQAFEMLTKKLYKL